MVLASDQSLRVWAMNSGPGSGVHVTSSPQFHPSSFNGDGDSDSDNAIAESFPKRLSLVCVIAGWYPRRLNLPFELLTFGCSQSVALDIQASLNHEAWRNRMRTLPWPRLKARCCEPGESARRDKNSEQTP